MVVLAVAFDLVEPLEKPAIRLVMFVLLVLEQHKYLVNLYHSTCTIHQLEYLRKMVKSFHS